MNFLDDYGGLSDDRYDPDGLAIEAEMAFELNHQEEYLRSHGYGYGPDSDEGTEDVSDPGLAEEKGQNSPSDFPHPPQTLSPRNLSPQLLSLLYRALQLLEQSKDQNRAQRRAIARLGGQVHRPTQEVEHYRAWCSMWVD